MNTAMQPAFRLRRIILWLTPSIYVTYSAIRWSFVWSPVHDTKMYLLAVAAGWIPGAVAYWMLTLPLIMLIVAGFNIFKWKHPRLTTLSTATFILLYAALQNEFALAMDD